MPPKVGAAMDRVKAGKGSNRKKKKKKKEEPKEDPNFLTEVDKTFYELQITDLNRKLARLRSLVTELELKNEELTKECQQMDEDRNDVINYLKKALAEKENEIKDALERLKALHETRNEETKKFEEELQQKELEFNTMHEQLTSEAKLLQGKLNALEEFRVQRDDLMKKYEEQEKNIEEQEVRHKREIYEIERKFIIGKDKLKKEMEARLLQLSTDFQDATEVRIASTTHRVIRENIAINNELDLLLETTNRLQEENDKLHQDNKVLRLTTELHDVEKKKAIHKAKVQAALIERLTYEHGLMALQVNNLKRIEEESKKQAAELSACGGEISNQKLKIRILEQNLHASRCEIVKLKTDLDFFTNESDRLTVIMCNAVKTIREALEIDKVFGEEEEEEVDLALIISKRQNLLDNLLTLLTSVENKKLRRPTADSVESIEATYFRGDLGFVPKRQELKYEFDIRVNVLSQVGPSFEDFTLTHKPSVEIEAEGEGSEAQLRIISDPDMLRMLLKERQMKKDAEKERRGEEICMEEEVESITFFDVQDVSEEASETAVDPTELDFLGGDTGDISGMLDIGEGFGETFEEGEGWGEEVLGKKASTRASIKPEERKSVARASIKGEQKAARASVKEGPRVSIKPEAISEEAMGEVTGEVMGEVMGEGMEEYAPRVSIKEGPRPSIKGGPRASTKSTKSVKIEEGHETEEIPLDAPGSEVIMPPLEEEGE